MSISNKELTLPPQNIEAEQAVLGAIFLDNAAYEKVAGVLTIGSFYGPPNQLVFAAMQDLLAKNEVVDLITVTDALSKSGDLDRIGGSAYLTDLCQSVATSASISYHARLVLESARLRQVQETGYALCRIAEEGRADPTAAAKYATKALSDLVGDGSIPAFKCDSLHERAFRPLPAIDFTGRGEESVQWVLEDYLPAGGLALLVGKPKEGKSTFVYELAVHVAQGHSFLGRHTTGGGVLILSLEEHPRDVRLRLQALGAATLSNLYIQCGTLDPSPTAMENISRFMADKAIKLVVVDTLAAFWQIADENDAAAMTKVVKPLLALARNSGACVLLVHHARKSEGSHGDEIRGSGALFALADVAIILKRHEIYNQRMLHGVSRYPETPKELVLELRETGYVALGDPSAINKQARREKVKAALSDNLEEAETILRRTGVSLRDGYRLLAALVKAQEAHREGKGRKGDPFRYRRILFHAASPGYKGSLHETESVSSLSEPSEEVIDLAN